MAVMVKFSAAFILIVFAAVPARAGVLNDWISAIERIADEPTSHDLYIPFWTYHMRFAYDDEHIRRYNERPTGLGFGASRQEGQVEHSLFFAGFEDSNYRFEGAFGYGWMRNLLSSGPLRLGYGFNIGLHMRDEYNHMPILLPFPVPMAELGFGRISAQAAYVPGWRNFGNVMLMWAKIRL